MQCSTNPNFGYAGPSLLYFSAIHQIFLFAWVQEGMGMGGSNNGWITFRESKDKINGSFALLNTFCHYLHDIYQSKMSTKAKSLRAWGGKILLLRNSAAKSNVTSLRADLLQTRVFCGPRVCKTKQKLQLLKNCPRHTVYVTNSLVKKNLIVYQIIMRFLIFTELRLSYFRVMKMQSWK